MPPIGSPQRVYGSVYACTLTLSWLFMILECRTVAAALALLRWRLCAMFNDLSALIEVSSFVSCLVGFDVARSHCVGQRLSTH